MENGGKGRPSPPGHDRDYFLYSLETTSRQKISCAAMKAHAGLLVSLDAGGILHGLAEGFHIEVHDLLRGALGQHQRTGGTVPFLVVAQLAQGGHVGIFGQTGGVEHAQDAQFGLVTAAQGGHVGHLGAGEVHFALAQGQQLVGGTAVGDGLVIEAGGSGQPVP